MTEEQPANLPRIRLARLARSCFGTGSQRALSVINVTISLRARGGGRFMRHAPQALRWGQNATPVGL